MLKVLFLCTENACRSQMAEGLVNHDLAGQVQAFSAGVRPSRVNPRAVQVMAELGIDISHHRSKSVDDLAGEQFDLVITVCDQAQEQCPMFPGETEVMHVGFPGPGQGHRHRRGDHGRLPAGAGRLAGATGAAAPGEMPEGRIGDADSLAELSSCLAGTTLDCCGHRRIETETFRRARPELSQIQQVKQAGFSGRSPVIGSFNPRFFAAGGWSSLGSMPVPRCASF